ncbi:MAG: alanine racemase [Clostridia bacterium]|nr:alanine racemase [Clostridia bacterium]
MSELLRRTWAQIDLDALGENIRVIKGILRPDVKLCATVKADGYGHGYAYTAAHMAENEVDWFAVSNLSEALQLRKIGISAPILILGYTPPERAEELAFNDISQAVFSASYAKALSDNAVLSGIKVNAHIKIDTGMSRLGFLYHDTVADASVLDEIETVCRLPGLFPEGIFTHFSSADCEDGELFTRLQYELFCSAADRLSARGITFLFRHCSNSAAILQYPEMQFDMVRAGIILYGMYPSESVRKTVPLRPVMELKTVISMIKTIPADTQISYGRRFTSDREMRVATVPVGYADGYPRLLSGKAYMLVNGQCAPVLGNVCMDQCMIDVTDIPDAAEGQTVTVFGYDNGAFLSADTLAKTAGLINYEIVCGISRRVPRIYKKKDEIVQVTDYMF